MTKTDRLLRTIDKTSETTAKFVRWFGVMMVVVVMNIEVVLRYVFGHPTMWTSATAPMLGAAMLTLGWSFVHQQHGNVRVDFLYTRFSQRGQALIDVLGDALVLFPLVAAMTYGSFKAMTFAWSMGQTLTETSWHPPAGPLRTVIFVGCALLALQGLANFIRSLSALRGRRPE